MVIMVRYKVKSSYFPMSYDELKLRIHDEIEVSKEYSDGWADALNLRTKERGVVPMSFLTLERPETRKSSQSPGKSPPMAHGVKQENANEIHGLKHMSETEFIQKYHLGKVLGQGTSGTVYELLNDPTHVFKCIHLNDQHPNFETNLKLAMKEFNVIKSIGISKDHHLAAMHDVFYTTKPGTHDILVWILMDRYEDLFDWLFEHNNFATLRATQVYRWFGQMAKALHKLHQHRIVHRDIKLENMLIDPKTKDIYLADFGLLCQVDMTGACDGIEGTSGYMAPEVVITQKAGPKSDIYSLGVSFWTMVTQGDYSNYATPESVKMVRFNKMKPEQYRKLVVMDFMRAFSPKNRPRDDVLDLFGLLRQMCEPNPELRPTTDDLKNWTKAHNLKA